MSERGGPDDALSRLGDDAMVQVDALAVAAQVRLAPVTSAAGHHDVARVFCEIWNAPPTAGPVRAGTMRAAQHVGAYVMGIHTADPDRAGVDPDPVGMDPGSGEMDPGSAGMDPAGVDPAAVAPGEVDPDPDRAAGDRGQMIGASFAFHGADGHLHSHVTGVLAEWQGRGLGLVTKLHQRAWCLQRGIDRVTWTFDPLVQRNARFNLQRLGAELVEYLPSFYGPMTDGINAGDDTDRAFVVWNLDSPEVTQAVAAASRRRLAPPHDDGLTDRDPDRDHGRTDRDPGRDDPLADPHADPRHGPVAVVRADDAGRPVVVAAHDDARVVAVATPGNIESLRRTDPELALRWRHAVRDAMHPRLTAGWRVAGITAAGTYLLEAP